jgi:hypothetical protein
MGEGITADNQKNIYCKNAKDKCQAAAPAIVKTLFDNGEHNWPHRYGEVKTKQQSFDDSIHHSNSYEDKRTKGNYYVGDEVCCYADLRQSILFL